LWQARQTSAKRKRVGVSRRSRVGQSRSGSRCEGWSCPRGVCLLAGGTFSGERDDDGRLAYEETTVVAIYGRIFDHTDRNEFMRREV